MKMRPLQGIRVLSLETWGSGAFHGELLAMLGAEVINIEDPRQKGNPLRTMGSIYLDQDQLDNEGNAFCLHNKKSLVLDLREEEGKRVFYRLIKTAHAVIDNFRGSKAESLGITYQDLKAHNPEIVCTHLSGYGRDNERKTWPGYDFLMQAETGWMSVTGEPGSPPTKVGVSVVDLLGSVYGALCTVSALLRAHRSSQGCDAETNLFDIALNCLCYQGMYYLNEGLVAGKQPRSAHATQCPSQIYRTKDGWVYIACLTQKFWELLCQKLDQPGLADDPRFETNNLRMENRDELTEIIDGVLMKHPTAFWTEKLSGTIPYSPVLDISQALENPFVTENGKLIKIPYDRNPQRENVTFIAPPLAFGGESTVDYTLPPSLGQNTDEILLALGYSEQEIKILRKEKIIS
jgi:succinate--hydroxymethylglutarate CoA-transferase